MQVEMLSGVSDSAFNAILQAISICYDSEMKSLADACRRIKKCISSGHSSVVEHCLLTFKISGVSRALTHQLVRHRIASYSQRSQRYCKESQFGFMVPPKIKENEEALQRFKRHMEDTQRCYNDLVAMGIPKEDARYVLPNACHTAIIVSMNIREFRHFIKLRACKRAQWEIREMALRMLEKACNDYPGMFLLSDLMSEFLGYSEIEFDFGDSGKCDTIIKFKALQESVHREPDI